MASSDLTVVVIVETIPWWQWGWTVPRNVLKRWRWLRGQYHGFFWAAVAAVYLGTFRIRIGKKTEI